MDAISLNVQNPPSELEITEAVSPQKNLTYVPSKNDEILSVDAHNSLTDIKTSITLILQYDGKLIVCRQEKCSFVVGSSRAVGRN